MLQIFRSFFQSKIGIVVTLAFLGLIAFAFASSDVANTGTFGGLAGGDRVALVGDRRIDANDLSVRATDTLNRVRQEEPTMTMEAFIAEDGLRDTLDALIARASITELGQMFGLRAGDRLIDSEIASDPSLRGADGTFSADAFRTFLRQSGISEDLYRDDRAMGLYTLQLVRPLQDSTQLPEKITHRYAQMQMESRSGRIAALMATAFLPDEDPSEAQIQAFYEENSDDYIRPERRVVRYATFSEDAFGSIAAPDETQIAEYYEAQAEQFAASENRSFTQLIATTQAAAQAIVDEVNSGVTLETSARNKGLSTAVVVDITRDALTSDASQTVADAGFTAEDGALSVPAQGNLGWYVLRVDNINVIEARSLEDARDEIVETLTAANTRNALNDGIVRIEDDFSGGRSLSEVAEDLGVEVSSTQPVTAAGQIYGTQDTAPEELAPVLSVAFDMAEGRPQLAELVPGETFIIYDVSDITRSAIAPMDEITEELESAWRFDQGLKAAGEATNRIIERVEGGSSLTDAVSAEETFIPAPDRVNLSRAQVEASGQITRPVALFFSMAEGTTKPLQAEELGAWFVVELNEITSPEIEEDHPVLAATRAQLLQFLPEEMTEQFVTASQDEVDIEINDVAIDAVASLLTGQTN